MTQIDVSRIMTAAQVAAAEAERIATRDLTRVEFEFLLASTGFEDVWSSMEAALKPVDPGLYATIRSQREMPRFRLSKTLEFVAQVRPLAAQVLPGVDLSDAAVRAAWAAVAAQS